MGSTRPNRSTAPASRLARRRRWNALTRNQLLAAHSERAPWTDLVLILLVSPAGIGQRLNVSKTYAGDAGGRQSADLSMTMGYVLKEPAMFRVVVTVGAVLFAGSVLRAEGAAEPRGASPADVRASRSVAPRSPTLPVRQFVAGAARDHSGGIRAVPQPGHAPQARGGTPPQARAQFPGRSAGVPNPMRPGSAERGRIIGSYNAGSGQPPGVLDEQSGVDYIASYADHIEIGYVLKDGRSGRVTVPSDYRPAQQRRVQSAQRTPSKQTQGPARRGAGKRR